MAQCGHCNCVKIGNIPKKPKATEIESADKEKKFLTN